jgi:hypothetical protein
MMSPLIAISALSATVVRTARCVGDRVVVATGATLEPRPDN